MNVRVGRSNAKSFILGIALRLKYSLQISTLRAIGRNEEMEIGQDLTRRQLPNNRSSFVALLRIEDYFT
jgi:hypothetical protein